LIVEYKISTISAVGGKINIRHDEENFSTCSISYSQFFQLCFPGAGYQLYNSTVQWDLATTIAYAKQNNIQVNIVRLDEKLSEQELLLAKAAKYPNLSGSATQSLPHSSNTNPVVGGFQTQSNLAGNYGLNSQELSQILRSSHKLTNEEQDDFTVRTQAELINTFSSTSELLTVLLAAIAGISLLVGGIGIMNIMYVSVTERTKEIGLRMSIGARGVDILMQFLIEAIVISITGGILGVLLGLLASKLITVFLSWPTLVSESSIVLSFVVCAITGIFFGYYPAQKASRLDPIEALRYE